MSSCSRHPFDQAEAVCRRCEDPICRDCRVDAKGRSWCIDCALAAAGVKSSGRSGKSAATYRRRANAVTATAVAARGEIDLRDDHIGVAPGARSSVLVRDLRTGGHRPASSDVVAPPASGWLASLGIATPPAPTARTSSPVRRDTTPRPPAPRRPAAGAGTPPPEGPPPPTVPDPSGGSEPSRGNDSTAARRRLLTVLAGAGVVGVAGVIASACGTSSSTNQASKLPGLSNITTTTTTPRPPGAPRRTPAVPGSSTPAAPDAPTAPTAPGSTIPNAPGSPRTPTRGGSRPPSAPAGSPPGGRQPANPPGSVAPPPSAGPAPTPPAPAPPVPDPVTEAQRQARLIERITFGPTPALVDEVSRLGSAAFLEQQLSRQPAGLDGVLTGPTILGMTPLQIQVALEDQNKDRRIPEELRHAAVVRAATHGGQLAEHMVAFWNNHFSTYSGEDDKQVHIAVPRDDLGVIRAHAMGRFADLVLANARSVSMQYYLDNFRSNATNPNQNYARELMELHTMGASNGYDEVDVDQVSRLLSGWGITGNLSQGTDVVPAFTASRHSTAPLSVTIAAPDGTVQTWSTPGRSGAAGEQDGVDFIDWLTHLPNTAQFISRKLARRFVGDTVTDALVESMAAVYLANDTQIVPVLRHMFTSAEFDASRRTKTKTPFEFLTGMIRASGATIDRTAGGPATGTIGDRLDFLGHGMWAWPTPDGFPEDPGFWITTSTVLRRWEVAGRLVNNRLNGITVNLDALMPSPLPATVGALVQQVAMRLGTGVDETAVSAISTFLGAAHDAPLSEINLGRVRGDLVAMLFSVPAYQYR